MKSSFNDDQGFIYEKDSWPFIFEEISLDSDDELDKLILEGHTLPCLYTDGFCKVTLKYP